MKNRFRPALLATLITLPAVLVMLGLGTWQLQRMSWKGDLMQRVEQRVHAAPVSLPATVSDPSSWEFRPVTVTGQFLHDKELRLLARPRQGQAGYEIVTPLVREDGGTVLINRGFVPMDKRDAAMRTRGQISGTVTVSGLVRLPQPAGLFQPDNSPGAETWVRAEPAAMGAALNLAGIAPLIVEAVPGQSPGGLPAGIEPRVELPNNHLQYALTWYGLAATLVAIYVLSQRRRGASEKGQTA